jgi:hypothetical protein
LNWRTKPLQYQQGASVVTIISIAVMTPPGVTKSIRFSMGGRIVFLNPPVVAAEEGRADSDVPFPQSQLGFRDGDSSHGGVIELSGHFVSSWEDDAEGLAVDEFHEHLIEFPPSRSSDSRLSHSQRMCSGKNPCSTSAMR